jgi:hypothetical protein
VKTPRFSNVDFPRLSYALLALETVVLAAAVGLVIWRYPSVSGIGLVVAAVSLLTLSAASLWLYAWIAERTGADEAFFTRALQRSDERLRLFAQQVNAQLRPGATNWLVYSYGFGRFRGPPDTTLTLREKAITGKGSSVFCSFDGLQVEVTSSVEDLQQGLTLVPRVLLWLPPGATWQRVPFMSGYEQMRGVLWASGLDGVSNRRVDTTTPEATQKLLALAEVSCCIMAASANCLDVRGRRLNGPSDPDKKLASDDFELATLFELVARSAAFARAAS